MISIIDGPSSLGATAVGGAVGVATDATAAAGVDAPTESSGSGGAAATPTSWIKLPLDMPEAADTPRVGFAMRPSSTSVL